MPGPQEKRASPRFRSRRFETPFGEVVDLSGGGMAVRHRGPRLAAGDKLRLCIRWGHRITPVNCTVHRVERSGFFHQKVGLRWDRPPAGLWEWLRGVREAQKPWSRGPMVFHRHGRRRAA